MKTLLVGINAKYIHTNLAIRNIVAYCPDEDISIYEATINDSIDSILEHIISYKADVIGFSCYLWNIEDVLYLSENIKKINPKIIIVLGGPEVSYEFEDILGQRDYIDFIIISEGEERFKNLLKALKGVKNIDVIDGLAYKEDGKILINPPRQFVDLNKIPLSYKDEDLDHKLVYYETSRGCLFNCAFCLSSLEKGVRTAELEKVERDFLFFAQRGVRVLKLVDRSFNCNMDRAIELLDIIRTLPGDMVIHCEINPELVNEDFIKALSGMEERLQFEIGVQSTNPKTLKEISRTPNVQRTLDGIRLLKKTGISLHVDLIAGLPYEDFETFSHSFDDVFNLYPHEIQLGFLKLLKGTRLKKEANKYGIQYRSRAPYEILYNDYISYEELCILKGIAWLLDKYHNTGRYRYILDYLISFFERPFDFYRSLYNYWQDNKLFDFRHSQKTMYEILYSYGKTILQVKEDFLRDIIKFDYILNTGKGAMPSCVRPETKAFLRRAKKHVYNEEWLEGNLPQAIGMTGQEVSRYMTFGYFKYDVPNITEREKGIVFLHKNGECFLGEFDI